MQPTTKIITNKDWVNAKGSIDADYATHINFDSVFYKGIWFDGIWKLGDFCDGIWIDGIWKNGTWHDRIWINGNWSEGRLLNMKRTHQPYLVSRISPKTDGKPKLTLSLNYAAYN